MISIKKSTINALLSVIFLLNIGLLYIVKNDFDVNIPFLMILILYIFQTYLLFKDVNKINNNQDIIKSKLENYSKTKNKYNLNMECNKSSINSLIPWILILCIFVMKIPTLYNSAVFWIILIVQSTIGIPIILIYSFARLIPCKNKKSNRRC